MMKIIAISLFFAASFLQSNCEVNVAGWIKNARDFSEKITNEIQKISQNHSTRCIGFGVEKINTAKAELLSAFDDCIKESKKFEARRGIRLENVPYTDSGLAYWSHKLKGDDQLERCFFENERIFHETVRIEKRRAHFCVFVTQWFTSMELEIKNSSKCIHPSIESSTMRKLSEFSFSYIEEGSHSESEASHHINDSIKKLASSCSQKNTVRMREAYEKLQDKNHICEKTLELQLNNTVETCTSLHKVERALEILTRCTIENHKNFYQSLFDIEYKSVSC